MSELAQVPTISWSTIQLSRRSAGSKGHGREAAEAVLTALLLAEAPPQRAASGTIGEMASRLDARFLGLVDLKARRVLGVGPERGLADSIAELAWDSRPGTDGWPIHIVSTTRSVTIRACVFPERDLALTFVTTDLPDAAGRGGGTFLVPND